MREHDRASWIRRSQREIDIAMLTVIERKGIAPANDTCEYVPVCHVYCLRKDAQSCSRYQLYEDIRKQSIPNEYNIEDVLVLT